MTNKEIMKRYGDIKLRFGRYKKQLIKDVPIQYLMWCIYNKALKGKCLVYAKAKVNFPKETYKVIVQDSLNGDGSYTTTAHSTEHEKMKVVHKHKIKCTQSFHGTTFTTVKL